MWCVLPKSDGIGQSSELRNSPQKWVCIYIYTVCPQKSVTLTISENVPKPQNKFWKFFNCTDTPNSWPTWGGQGLGVSVQLKKFLYFSEIVRVTLFWGHTAGLSLYFFFNSPGGLPRQIFGVVRQIFNSPTCLTLICQSIKIHVHQSLIPFPQTRGLTHCFTQQSLFSVESLILFIYIQRHQNLIRLLIVISDPPRRDSYTLVGFSDRPRRLSYICKHWMAAVAVIGRDVFLHMYTLVGCGRCRSGDWPPQRISYICNRWLAAVAVIGHSVSHTYVYTGWLPSVRAAAARTQPRWSLDQGSSNEYMHCPQIHNMWFLASGTLQERTFLTTVYVTTKFLARPPDYSGKFWGRPPMFWLAFGDRATAKVELCTVYINP